MSDSIQARLAALRAEMAKRGIDLYVVSSSDFHGSEYIGAYFKTREYLTGFTGSAGTAVILPDEAYLWTDGRYFIQAKRELSGSGISLMRMGEAGVPSVREFVQKRLPMVLTAEPSVQRRGKLTVKQPWKKRERSGCRVI